MRCSIVLAVLATTAPIFSTSFAQAPDSLSFQGLLTDSFGDPLDSAGVSMTFKLYAGSSEVWSETQSVDVVNGIYNVYLGKVTKLDTVAFNQPMDLGIKLDGEDSEMSPRTPLAAAAFALGMRGMYAYEAVNSVFSAVNVVGGSAMNTVSGGVTGATIAGGGGFQFFQSLELPNRVTGNLGTVGGGGGNTVSGGAGTVGGGVSNTASGAWATVPGGEKNSARGFYSFAAGRAAKANHDGAFVWNDFSSLTDDSLLSTGNNQFLARASGGFKLFTAASPDMVVGVELSSGSGAWAMLSSETSKTDFQIVDTRDYLDRLAALTVKEWRYKTEDPTVTHVGPMAEEFYSTFGHGPSERSITTVDADGVALAAIQGLYELVKDLQAEIERLRQLIEE